jgi:hypothetical protein
MELTDRLAGRGGRTVSLEFTSVVATAFGLTLWQTVGRDIALSREQSALLALLSAFSD